MNTEPAQAPRCKILREEGSIRLFIDDEHISEEEFDFKIGERKHLIKDDDGKEILATDTYIMAGSLMMLEPLKDISLADLSGIIIMISESSASLNSSLVEDNRLVVDSGSGTASYTLNLKYDDWTMNFSPREFLDGITKMYWEYFELEESLEGIELDSIPIIWKLEAQVREVIEESMSITKQLIKDTIDLLSSEKSEGLISLEFDFPPHLKFACEQYLMYFGQFLKDAGENVDLELSHHDGKTLFSVVPENKDIGLSKINEALSIYLSLSENRSPAQGSLSLAESRTQAVIAGYQSQIMSLQVENNARNLELRAARITLTGQQNLIGQQGEMIARQSEIMADQAKALANSTQSGNILAESLRIQEEETEDVIGGVVKVKAYDIGPLQLDIPEALRKVKDLFKRD
ncbi:hypothetical protein K7W42_07755 [Deinococcus sp. HMF7604]|uniref:hypothetical protein n=1 Tax=Deinococcus betulae TaxID=2873312 RepID=UPI001CCE19D5|nr:hypothetical protein [Deinococcus betulae]MBZ9750754.1 hypothetical protein [Deinococcus betulae]